ncbi:homeobox protein PKNOX2-like [Sitophilus oryzae]|uniref:Homeobox protein PKNOX2-like n=1 Tax=Sitophilus oryzae TaxID=7048 RepID=A0A6J2YDB5_SITOR|nr:homeobox protein PKNOX2-like [Sitophilus oryzae]
MLSVPTPPTPAGPLSDSIAVTAPPPSVTQAAFAPPDTDQAQFEADKRAVYKHPLFPLLALLFERCELATQSSEPQSSDAFNLDIQAFVQHQERDRKPFLANEVEIDGLMIKAIQVLRIHLLELEKVQELCKDFCNRYITCLKGKMQSEHLLRSDYSQDILGTTALLNNIESNNNMLSHNNSESGSDSNSPLQFSISPSHASMSSQPPHLDGPSNSHLDNASYALQHYNESTPSLLQSTGIAPDPSPVPAVVDQLVVHGSTPLSQIGTHCASTTALPSDNSGPLSPAPTTPGGSNDDCDSDISRGGKKTKRGILPKHATSVMRSWLFQHLVHPYPTEDEKRHIASQTNLTLLQVNNWFINARRRILQPMLDATAPTGQESGGQSNSPNGKKKKNQNNNRRFWPQEFGNIQSNIDCGMLSSSDEGGDSYSSDEEGGSLIIDACQANEVTQNNEQEENNLDMYENMDIEQSKLGLGNRKL